jgi:hypothetical protein
MVTTGQKRNENICWSGGWRFRINVNSARVWFVKVLIFLILHNPKLKEVIGTVKLLICEC